METQTNYNTNLKRIFNKKQREMENRLTVELVLVTPEVASNYLKLNNKNRSLSKKHFDFLTKEMKDGRFLENGESIIFDKNGELKDGQHRLSAIIRSGKSYFIPIVRGVEPVSMSTYDTGKNRTASDVLSINGFKQSNQIASFIIARNVYYDKKNKPADFSATGNRMDKLTNQQVLEYCKENYNWIRNICLKVTNIKNKSNPIVLSVTQLSLIAYFLGGKYPSDEVYEYLLHLTGAIKELNSAPSYLYNKLYNAKVNKEPLNFYWIIGMSIKGYNYFIDGNASVQYFKFSTSQELPKVNKINN